jgi:hypothetical protein
MTPTTLLILAVFICGLTRLPDKYRPPWIKRPASWPSLLSLAPVIAALLIVMNPEFYPLGILGDLAFFDILVLGISLQIQITSAGIGSYVAAGLSEIMRLARWRLSVTCSALLLTCDEAASVIQRAAQWISSRSSCRIAS